MKQALSNFFQKDEFVEREDRWNFIAQKEGYHCIRCRQTPPYGEREIYFETSLCGLCKHIMDKDD